MRSSVPVGAIEDIRVIVEREQQAIQNDIDLLGRQLSDSIASLQSDYEDELKPLEKRLQDLDSVESTLDGLEPAPAGDQEAEPDPTEPSAPAESAPTEASSDSSTDPDTEAPSSDPTDESSPTESSSDSSEPTPVSEPAPELPTPPSPTEPTPSPIPLESSSSGQSSPSPSPIFDELAQSSAVVAQNPLTGDLTMATDTGPVTITPADVEAAHSDAADEELSAPAAAVRKNNSAWL